MSASSFQDAAQVARLAVLAMCARGAAACEFEDSPDVHTLRVTVGRYSQRGDISVDVEFLNSQRVPVGGMSL